MRTLELTAESKDILSRNPEFVKAWVKGLRSGKYSQTSFRMGSTTKSNCTCVLGVMEAECNGQDLSRNTDLTKIGATPSQHIENPLMLEEGFPEDILQARCNEDYDYYPSEWNDILNLSFNQIANLLEYGKIEVHKEDK